MLPQDSGRCEDVGNHASDGEKMTLQGWWEPRPRLAGAEDATTTGQEMRFSMYLPKRVWVPPGALALVAGLLLAAAGCAAFRVPEEPPEPTPLAPVWSQDELKAHLRNLNETGESGRTTGTQGYARAAAYVASRLRDFHLQPAVESDFRIIYGASLNYPLSAALRLVGDSDSTFFLPGFEFLPDARSDSGGIRVSRFVVADAGIEPHRAAPETFGVLAVGDIQVDLHAWRDAGARLALIVGELMPQIHPEPVRGLIVLQITPATAGRLIGLPVQEPEDLTGRAGAAFTLGRSVAATVATDFQRNAGAINMMGYFSGKHAERQRDLVIVCADLDAVGRFGAVHSVDFRNFGVATAALLEVTRNLGYISRRWALPERTVMIAIWSGSELGHEGLRYFLEHPTWNLDRVRSLIYLGLEDDEAESVQQLLRPYGIPLITIPPRDEPLYDTPVLLTPDPAVRRIARERGIRFDPRQEPDMDAIVDSAIVQATELAGRAYSRVMLEATSDEPFFPMAEDSLAEPSAAGFD